MEKSEDTFEVLAEDHVAHPSILPSSITQMLKFFHRGKSKKDRSKTFTNFRIVHTEDINNIIDDPKCELEIENITPGLQKVQHHNVAKEECIFGLFEKIHLKD